jgi:hypothetical protein
VSRPSTRAGDAKDEPAGPPDPVAACLDSLRRSLPGPARQVRDTLTEIEAHLLDAVAELRAAGFDDAEARAAAVRRLGPVGDIVAGMAEGARLAPARIRRLVLGVLVIGGVGGLAIAAGGAIAWLVRALWGARAIASPFPSDAQSAANCARWLAGYPHSANCAAAMTADHAADFLAAALVCGLLGAAAFAALALLRRRWSSDAVIAALPHPAEDVAGAGLAFAATVLLVGRGIDAALVQGDATVGQSLSLALPAAAATAFFALRAARRRPPLMWSGPRVRRLDG